MNVFMARFSFILKREAKYTLIEIESDIML